MTGAAPTPSSARAATSGDPDVLVVGAGPAGTTAAGILAAAGWHVLVVDRARFPRPKACGECLNPGGVAALARLGLLERVAGLAPVRLEGWRLRGDGVDVSAGFGGDVHGLGIAREVLDHALLQAARERGADVLEGTRVEGVEAARAHGRPAVRLRLADGSHRTVRPRLVVGADGLRSVVSRALGLVTRTPRLKKTSLTFHVRAEEAPAAGEEPGGSEGVLDTRDGITLGLAPVGRGGPGRGRLWNATVVAGAGRHGRRVAADPVGFFERVMEERGGLPGGVAWRIEGGPWASGPFDWPVRRRWAPGVVLVGDAAGYYDPFTGQGIHRALRSAEMAAEAVVRVLAAPEPSWTPLALYDAAWRREVRASVWVQHGVEAVMSRGPLRRGVLRRLDASGGLRRVIRVTGDVASPVTLLAPRVWL